MNRIQSAPLAAAAILLLAPVARAGGLDLEVGNGDRIAGTLDPAADAEVFRVRVPRGALLTVKAKAAKRGPTLAVDLVDPKDAVVRTGAGAKVSFAKHAADASGLWAVRVRSSDGVATGDYALTIGWTSPRSAAHAATLAADGTATLGFAVDAGASVTIATKPGKRSAATPALTLLTAPDASETPLTGTTAKRTLAAGGEYAVAFASTTAGEAVATVKVKPPKPTKRKLALTSRVIGGQGGEAAFAAVLGTGGGTVTFPPAAPGEPGAELAGSSVTIPANVLPSGSAIVIATSTDVDAPLTTPAGPPVFFGPDGTRFDKEDRDASATVTIPYDPAFDGSTDALVIYTRDSKGKVSAVPPPYQFDAVAHTVSFQTSHFSSFQAATAATFETPEMVTRAAGLSDPRDACYAFDSTSAALPIFYYVAEGAARRVTALRLAATPDFLFTKELYVGGGASSADGTARLQFAFPGDVVAVAANVNGDLFVATETQVFLVSASTGAVTRVAGTGAAQDAGDNGSALQASFVKIVALAIEADDQSFWVADVGAHRIRFVDAQQGGTIRGYAGTGAAAVGADNQQLVLTSFLGPTDVEVDGDGGLYVTDGGRLRQIKAGIPGFTQDVNVTVAGDAGGATGNSGDGGSLLAARFQGLSSVSLYFDPFDPTSQKVLVSDSSDHTIRVLDRTNDRVSLFAGRHGVQGDAPDAGPRTGAIGAPRGLSYLGGQIGFLDAAAGKLRTVFSFGN